MSESMNGAGQGRSRYGNVVSQVDARHEAWGFGMQRYGHDEVFLADAAGSVDLGYAHVSLRPGKRSFPFHAHHSEEEFYYVLAGRALLRQGDADGEERVEVGPGDAIAFPPGTGIAHQFINAFDAPFVYLVVSTRHPKDVIEYPDSNKVLIRRTETILRREPNLEYFDGEL